MFCKAHINGVLIYNNSKKILKTKPSQFWWASRIDKWVTFIDDLLSLLVGINGWGIEGIDPGISKGRLIHEKTTNRRGGRDWASLQVLKCGMITTS